jgi:hypothetical protein
MIDMCDEEVHDSRHHHDQQHDINQVEEQKHFESVCEAYRQYSRFAMAQWTNRQFRLMSLPESQRCFLPSGMRPADPNNNDANPLSSNQERMSEYKDAVIRNQFCLDCILRHAGQPHSQEQQQLEFLIPNHVITDEQISKVSSVLKSLMRDWSAEGKVLQVVHHMLRPGGFLINVRPLLYHWSGPMLRPDDGTWQNYRQRHSHLDDRYMTSIDLAYDDIKDIMSHLKVCSDSK